MNYNKTDICFCPPTIHDRKATVYIFFEMRINWTTFKILKAHMLYFIDNGATEINLIMSSNGGDCDAAVTCFNFLKSLEIKLTTHNYGDVDSASILIFLAARKRLSVSNGKFLLLPLSYEVNKSLTIIAIENIILQIQHDTDITADIYATRLGISNQEAAGLLAKERRIDAYKAQVLGLVTEVVPLHIPTGSIIDILPLPVF